MAEVVLGKQKLVDKIVDYTVAPIRKQYSYIYGFDRNIEKLERQLDVLRRIKQGVQRAADVDHIKHDAIAADIKTWMISVHDVESEAKEILGKKPEVQKGLFPNPKLRYSWSRKAVKKTKVIVDLQEVGLLFNKPFCSPPAPIGRKTIPSKDYMAFESRSRNMEQIIKALTDDNINLIGICGLPGVGKTTIAKGIEKQTKEDGLFVEVAWAVVGQSKKLTDIQACIADMLGLKELGDVSSPVVRADRLRERLLQDNMKILVILDDVWEEFDLEDMGIPLGGANKNFKMLYTSRNRSLWREKKSKFEVPLDLLSKDEAWKLYMEQVGDCADAPDLQPIAKDIVNACGRLPLVLVLIAKALSEVSSGNATKYVWEDIRDQLTCSRSTPEDMDWSKPLELSYRAIKHEEAKRLFLLCCLFEEDKSIPVEVWPDAHWDSLFFMTE